MEFFQVNPITIVTFLFFLHQLDFYGYFIYQLGFHQQYHFYMINNTFISIISLGN